MCPKIDQVVIKNSTDESQSRFDRWKMKFTELHRVTIFAISLYLIFVLIFVCANILTCAWHWTMRRTKQLEKIPTDRQDPLLEQTNHLPLSIEEETESETSFGDDHNGILDRMGRKIDDRLHQIFTS